MGSLSKCTLLLLLLLVLLMAIPDGSDALFNRNKNDKNDVALPGRARKTAEEMQAINDAATGTVKQNSPGHERPPTTCNEMMARAVVLANEERATAYAERDEMSDVAEKALHQVESTQAQLDAANDQVSRVQQEMEYLEANTTRRVDEALAEAKAQVEGIINATDAQMEQLRRETNTTLNLYVQEKDTAIAQARQNATDEIAAYKRARDEQVAAVEAKARLKMEEAEAKVAGTINATNVQIAAAKQEADERIRRALEETDRAQADAKAQIEREKTNAKEAIAKAWQDANAKSATDKAAADRRVADMQLAVDDMTQTVAKEREEMTQTVAKEREEMQLRIVTLIKETQAEIASIRKQTSEDMQRLRESTDREVGLAKQKAQETVSMSSNEAAKKVEEISKQMDKTKDKVQKLQLTLRQLTIERDTLSSDLAAAQEDLRYWVSLHNAQPYCNVTLLQVHSERALFSAMDLALEETVFAWRESGRMVASLYSKHVAPLVATHVEPVVGPHWAKVRQFYAANLEQSANKISSTTQKGAAAAWTRMMQWKHQIWSIVVSTAHRLVAWELAFLERKVHRWTPIVLLSFMQYLISGSHMETFLLFWIRIAIIMAIWVHRNHIVKRVRALLQPDEQGSGRLTLTENGEQPPKNGVLVKRPDPQSESTRPITKNGSNLSSQSDQAASSSPPALMDEKNAKGQ